jgi:hypothetical protein
VDPGLGAEDSWDATSVGLEWSWGAADPEGVEWSRGCESCGRVAIEAEMG